MDQITIYTQPGCQRCAMTRSRFEAYGVEVKMVDVSQDPAALNMIKGLGYLEVPVVTVTSSAGELRRHWSGFRDAQIAEAARSCASPRVTYGLGPADDVYPAPYIPDRSAAGPHLVRS